jgi:hypothetical protein
LAIILKDGVISSLSAFENAASAEDMNKFVLDLQPHLDSNFRLTSYGRVYADLCLMLLEPIVNNPGEELGDLTALELLFRAADYND